MNVDDDVGVYVAEAVKVGDTLVVTVGDAE